MPKRRRERGEGFPLAFLLFRRPAGLFWGVRSLRAASVSTPPDEDSEEREEGEAVREGGVKWERNASSSQKASLE